MILKFRRAITNVMVFSWVCCIKFSGDIMDKKTMFREFIKTRPELVNYVMRGEASWQKFYEIYDLYGEDENVWSKYQNVDDRVGVADGISKITNIVKNVDMNSIKSHINTAQKAIDLVQDLATKKVDDVVNNAANLAKGPVAPRPLNKFFED